MLGGRDGSRNADTPSRLVGRRAFVTGAGSGIGRASALRLAAEGAAVAVLDVRDDAVQPVVAEIERGGGRAVGLAGDIRDEDAVRRATEAAAVAFAGLDVVVACAGITASGPT